MYHPVKLRYQPEETPGFPASGRQVHFLGVSSRGCHKQTLKALINLCVRNRGVSPQHSMLDWFFSALEMHIRDCSNYGS